jgi:Carboxypeptidase regulatory-like domain
MSRPVGDCRVEIIDGPRAGTFVMTAASGGFGMPGVFSDAITVQASKAGFITETKTVAQPDDRRPRLFVSFSLDFTDPSAALYTLSGIVTEPGGPSIAGVHVSTSTGSSTVTDANGRYVIPGLFVIDKITFAKDGYEPRGPFGPWYRNLDLNIKLQRTIRMRGGEQLTMALLPDDVFYEPMPSPVSDPDDMCGPCKLLRVAKPGEGTLDVWVSSDNPGLTFGIWEIGKWDAHQIGNGETAASISTMTSEVQILVGTIWRGTAPPFTAPQSLRVRTSVR